jgi:hypothetical protein
MDPCTDAENFNGGLFLYEPAVHRPLMDEWCEVGERAEWTKHGLPEQSAMSILLARDKEKYPVTWLPHDYNRIMYPQWDRRGPMPYPIMHFVGGPQNGDDCPRIHRTWWNLVPSGVLGGRSLEIVRRTPKDGTVVEVGVLWGANAHRVLHVRQDVSMVLVDRWDVPTERYKATGDGEARGGPGRWSNMLRQVKRIASKYEGRVRVLQSDSVEAADHVGLADLVFIDADHGYEGCKGDVLAWLPKVKPGGWIGGHDYDPPKWPEWGVKRAVDEVAAQFGLTVELGEDQTWWCRVGG